MMKRNKYYFDGLRNNNHKVIHEFITKCNPFMDKLAHQFPSLSADDIQQEALLVVLKKIKEGSLTEEKMTAQLSTYLYSVALNQCRDKMKKKAHSPLEMNVDIAEENNDDEKLYEERLFHVRDLASMVKPPCNDMLFDYYLRKISYEDMAVKYGYKNANSAKKKNSECLKKARKLVGENKSLKKIFYNYAY